MDDRCKKLIWNDWKNHKCKRKAVKDGYCRQHHTDSVRVRREKRMIRLEDEHKKSPYYLLQKALDRIKELEAEISELKAAAESQKMGG